MRTSTSCYEDQYTSVKKLVFMLAKKHHGKYGGGGYDFDSVLSDANSHFLHACETFDSGKGKFITWVYTCVTQGLLGDFRKRLNEVKIETRRRELVRVPTVARVENKFSLEEFLVTLSNDARSVVSLLVEYPLDLASLVGAKKTRGPIKSALKALLREQGWVNSRIQACFEEISVAVTTRES